MMSQIDNSSGPVLQVRAVFRAGIEHSEADCPAGAIHLFQEADVRIERSLHGGIRGMK
jgi:hypothetical protein